MGLTIQAELTRVLVSLVWDNNIQQLPTAKEDSFVHFSCFDGDLWAGSKHWQADLEVLVVW